MSMLECRRRKQMEIEEPLRISINNGPTKENQKSSTSINGVFLHSQLIIDSLQRIAPNVRDQDEFLAVCKQEYKNDASALIKIQEFSEKYSPEDALWWYTRNTFLYRILNKSLRAFDIHNLFLLRFVIKDLYHQLLRRQSEQSNLSITVYRGQSMSQEELSRLQQSIDKIVSFNSFLSTSFDRDVCLFIAGDTNNSNERVLFQIRTHANKCTSTKPFANIADDSAIPDEEEILFMLGSLFRLNKIAQQDDGVWLIQMTLCNDDDHDLKPLFEHLRSYGDNPAGALVQFVMHLREGSFYSEAKSICQRILYEFPPSNDPSRLVREELKSDKKSRFLLDDTSLCLWGICFFM